MNTLRICPDLARSNAFDVRQQMNEMLPLFREFNARSTAATAPLPSAPAAVPKPFKSEPAVTPLQGMALPDAEPGDSGQRRSTMTGGAGAKPTGVPPVARDSAGGDDRDTRGQVASFPPLPDVNGGIAAFGRAVVQNQQLILQGLQKLTASLGQQQSRIEAINREIEHVNSRARNLRDGR